MLPKKTRSANNLRASYKLAKMFHMTPIFVKKKFTALPMEAFEKINFLRGGGKISKIECGIDYYSFGP